MDTIIITEQQIASFEAYLTREEKSGLTISKYIRDVHSFYAFLGGNGECTKEDVIRYKQELAAAYRTSSINSMLAAVNHFLGYIGAAQFRVKQYKVQRQIFRAEEKELTQQEYKKLLRAARRKKSERLEMVVQTLCATGIRISELKYFTVAGVNKGRLEVYCKNKQRVVFIPDELRRRLQLYCAKHQIRRGQIFVTKSGKPLDRSNIWSEMKHLSELAGVAPDKVFPHNLRHLFARTYYQMEKDITKLADLLGHCSIETTRIYIISTGREHRRQLNGLGLLM